MRILKCYGLLIAGLLALSGCGTNQPKPSESSDAAQTPSATQQLIDQAEQEAQFKLALRYATGQGVTQDSSKALSLWLQLAEQHRESQYYLGMSFLKGFFNTPVNTEAGLRWLTKAATNQHPIAQFELSRYYAEQNDAASQQQAQHWLQQAAINDHYQAQYRLGKQLQKSTDPQQQQQATPWLEKSFHMAKDFAAAGDKDANYILGRLLIDGDGIEANRPQGLVLLLRAALLDQPDAIADLNQIRLDKHKRDPKDLISAAEKAYRKGHRKTANRYLMQAARFGQINQLVHQANRLLSNESASKRDVEIAIAMLTQAGLHGNRTSMKILAALYNQGYSKRLKKNLEKAYSWGVLLATLNDAQSRQFVQQFNDNPPLSKWQFKRAKSKAKQLVSLYQTNTKRMWEGIQDY